jgi:hypothetical protein
MTPSSSAALRIHARLREAAAAADAGSTRHVPDERIIAQALDVAFWASLRREEGVAPTISLALAASEDVAQPLRFARPLPLAAGPLAKLAPAVKRPGIHLGVWTGPEGAAVWGTTMDLRPRTLVIEVVAPGLLVAKYRRDADATKYTNILVIEGDVVRVLDTSVPQRPDCPRVVTSLFGFESAASWVASADVLVQLAVSMRAHERGGALLVVPAGDESWRTSTASPLTYDVSPPYTELSERAASARLAHPLGQWPPDMARAIASVAGLTAVDGATVLTRDYALLAFGVKLVRRKGWPAVERILVTEPIEGQTPAEVEPVQLGGTRHLSAAQFVHDQREAVALVASQDGRFTVFSWSTSHGCVHAHRVEALLL